MADEYSTETTDEAVAARRAKNCKERGVVVVEPDPDQLFVDIDNHHGLGVFHANVRSLGNLVVSHSQTISPSRKSGHWHVTVRLSRPVKDNFERIALQCLLGSDLAREMVSWREATLGLSKPTVFFEKPVKEQIERT